MECTRSRMPLPECPNTRDVDAHHIRHAQGLAIEPHTAATRWMGEAMDYQIAIDSLRFRERRAARVSAEMPEEIQTDIIAATIGPSG